MGTFLPVQPHFVIYADKENSFPSAAFKYGKCKMKMMKGVYLTNHSSSPAENYTLSVCPLQSNLIQAHKLLIAFICIYYLMTLQLRDTAAAFKRMNQMFRLSGKALAVFMRFV